MSYGDDGSLSSLSWTPIIILIYEILLPVCLLHFFYKRTSISSKSFHYIVTFFSLNDAATCLSFTRCVIIFIVYEQLELAVHIQNSLSTTHTRLNTHKKKEKYTKLITHTHTRISYRPFNPYPVT